MFFSIIQYYLIVVLYLTLTKIALGTCKNFKVIMNTCFHSCSIKVYITDKEAQP